MRVRTLAPLAVAALVASAYAPAHAAPPKKKKPITKTYTLRLLPTQDATEATACSGDLRTADVNTDFETIKVTGPGILTAEINGFVGDWDMSVWSSSGSMLSEGGGTTTPETLQNTAPKETMKYKSKKAQTLTLRVCNFNGTLDATVKYTYTYS